jgi:transcriptional regulator with XRE-family HTH domain
MDNKFESLSLGEKIKLLRENKGLSQGALAKKSEISVAEICRIEKGERQNPSVNLLNKLLTALEVDSETYLQVTGYK